MIELKGKYAEAKIFTDLVDPSALAQVTELLNQPFIEGQRVRMMPDIHAGKGCTIGTTMTIGEKICPNLVGVDIGCGMETLVLEEREADLPALDEAVRRLIPAGFQVRGKAHPLAENIDLSALCCAAAVDLARARQSIGTLGGGNHFIELDRDDEGGLYLVVHSGSRHLGQEIARYYQQSAWEQLQQQSERQRREGLEILRAQGRQSEAADFLKRQKAAQGAVSKELAYVQGHLCEQYLHDMRIAQRFAALNRQAITEELLRAMGWRARERFATVHNYIDLEQGILRKGAVSAQAGERLLIPINMRDGSLLCRGKGNEDWNFSAPHGAGRLMSRAEAKSALSVEEFRRQMQGVYSSSVGRGTLDEAPMAYKSMDDIVENIAPTADIECVLRSVYNFKAGG